MSPSSKDGLNALSAKWTFMPSPCPGGLLSRTTPLSEHVHTVVEECPGTVLLETSRFDSSHKCSYLFLKPIGLTAEERIVTAEDLKAADAVFLVIPFAAFAK